MSLRWGGEEEPEILHIDESIRAKQIQRLNSVRARRNREGMERRLEQLKRSARTDENLLPPILACVESYATVGEISDALRSVWGEYET